MFLVAQGLSNAILCVKRLKVHEQKEENYEPKNWILTDCDRSRRRVTNI